MSLSAAGSGSEGPSKQPASKPAAKAGAPQKPGKAANIGMIKRGAPDLKHKLQEASSAGQAIVVLWTSAAAEAACAPAVQALQSVASGSTGERKSPVTLHDYIWIPHQLPCW